jgi:hypothetical protein
VYQVLVGCAPEVAFMLHLQGRDVSPAPLLSVSLCLSLCPLSHSSFFVPLDWQLRAGHCYHDGILTSASLCACASPHHWGSSVRILRNGKTLRIHTLLATQLNFTDPETLWTCNCVVIALLIIFTAIRKALRASAPTDLHQVIWAVSFLLC